MKLSRRQALRFIASAAPVLAARPGFAFFDNPLALTKGPFKPTAESLSTNKIPDWFRDAKFGIWSHWGPQSGIEHGDWYARKMYIQGEEQYKYHLATYGHPSRIGYKDLVPQFKASKWDPEHLIDLYAKAGARYFFSMGVHHDNFDMWNSKYQPRWNAVATGPKRDIVGEWARAARARGLKFGVSEHLSNSFEWLAPAHLSDTEGPLAGVPYDGSDPAYKDLYHDYSDMGPGFAERIKLDRMGRKDAPERWKLNYFRRVKDLVDQHQPDLLYTDGGIPFAEYGLSTVAELYNVSAGLHGTNQSVYSSKTDGDCKGGSCVLDRERGVVDVIWPDPWQTDTCIGGWHYKRGQKYKSAKKVIDLLVDIVSKNGNLLLNFPLPNSGELDAEELVTLNGITEWMSLNSDGIYSTRPWTICGEGPSMQSKAGGGGFNENKKPDLGASDFRFTRKNSNLYAFAQGYPEHGKEYLIESLSFASAQKPGKIANVVVLGSDEKLRWTQDEAGLRISNPKKMLPAPGCCFKISFS